MKPRRRIFIEAKGVRTPTPVTAHEREDAADVAMRLREAGYAPYRLRFDPQANAWIAQVIDWERPRRGRPTHGGSNQSAA